ncbi:MAG: TIGR02186 family protein [Gemmatimonadota bacterium]|jgi:uncharacterized protein (TIGR02186 family)
MRAFLHAPALFLAWSAAAAAGQVGGTPPEEGISLDPPRVVAGMFFSGADVVVRAAVPPGAEVAMVLRGKDRELSLKKKGKAFGLVWMNMEDVLFRAVPDVYLLRSSAPVEALAPPPILEEAGVGLDALAARSGPRENGAGLFGELVRLKERDGLWSVEEGDVRLGAAEEGTAAASAEFFLPASTPPGTYHVLVHTFVDGRAELVGSRQIVVSQEGLASLISDLAQRHGLLYGILASLFAVVVGLGTGLAFGRGSGSSH